MGELDGEVVQREGEWCRVTHPSGPFSDMLEDQRLTSKVPCSIAAEANGACCMVLELHRGELGVSPCRGVASAEMKSVNGVYGVRLLGLLGLLFGMQY